MMMKDINTKQMQRKTTTVNSYLTNIANSAVIRDEEKQNIQRSISTIQSRLDNYFPDELADHFLFGSYTRGTILPRNMDPRSDIDYMVVFKDSNYQPQTYLDRLRRFVNFYYNKSEIFQSSPSIVLELNHIRFELVPAICSWLFNELLIPAKASEVNDWIDTNPYDFNQTLIKANQANNNMIKPTIRLVKYWNARNNHVFESYELEKTLAEGFCWQAGVLLDYGQLSFGSLPGQQLKNYFFEAMESLTYGWGEPMWKKNAIDRAHQIVRKAIDYLQNNMEKLAVREVQRLIPAC